MGVGAGGRQQRRGLRRFVLVSVALLLAVLAAFTVAWVVVTVPGGSTRELLWHSQAPQGIRPDAAQPSRAQRAGSLPVRDPDSQEDVRDYWCVEPAGGLAAGQPRVTIITTLVRGRKGVWAADNFRELLLVARFLAMLIDWSTISCASNNGIFGHYTCI